MLQRADNMDETTLRLHRGKQASMVHWVRHISRRHCERSEAIHRVTERKNGLLRRFAPLRKRFAFVAGNDDDEAFGGA